MVTEDTDANAADRDHSFAAGAATRPAGATWPLLAEKRLRDPAGMVRQGPRVPQGFHWGLLS
jgi:hypothetical protein